MTFEQATEAFFDPFLKVVVDASRKDEARDAIIGMDTRWNLLFVVYIELEEDAIRIISARQATRKERTDCQRPRPEGRSLQEQSWRLKVDQPTSL